MGQLRAWSMEKFEPHTQVLDSCVDCQLYLMHRASRKSPLWNANPCSSIGRQEGHEDAPFSLHSSMARCRCQGNIVFSRVALSVPSQAIAEANKEVQKAIQATKRGPCLQLSPSRCEIA